MKLLRILLIFNGQISGLLERTYVGHGERRNWPGHAVEEQKLGQDESTPRERGLLWCLIATVCRDESSTEVPFSAGANWIDPTGQNESTKPRSTGPGDSRLWREACPSGVSGPAMSAADLAM